MSELKPKKMLLTFDGSDRGLKTVRYIAQFEPFKNMQIKLFHVFSGIPESYWDLEKEPKAIKTVVHVRAWESQQKIMLLDYMRQAREILLNAGFPPENVTVNVYQRKKGIARDIIGEAKKYYDILVSRRRGFGALSGLVLGSVATKLLENVSFVPLLLAGRKPPRKKILVALDGSEASWRALDFVGSTLGGHDFEIGLIHVIRGNEKSEAKTFHLFSPKRFIAEAEKDIAKVFKEAERRLVKADFKPSKIETFAIIGARSRAAAIAEEAKNEGYDTIVLGRRGLSRAKDFSTGRITKKIIQLARVNSVWVIP